VGYEACHQNGDCTNDSPKNLRWGTSQSNKEDMKRHGTRIKGEQINTCKLSEIDIPVIRNRRKQGERLKQIANDYNMSETQISDICNNKSWKHI
jgi:hypothetical protein